MKQLVKMLLLPVAVCLAVVTYKFLTSQVLDSRLLLIILCLNRIPDSEEDWKS